MRQLYKQNHSYRLEFWLRDPADDILSSLELPGIIDQALAYAHSKRVIADETGACIMVEPGLASVVKDPIQDTGLYYVFLELIFQDGLHRIEEAETFSDAQVKIKHKGAAL